MKGHSLTSLAGRYGVDDLEKGLIYKFITNHSLDYSRSAYLTDYLYGFVADEEMMQALSTLGHHTLEELVVDMELLIPPADRKMNGAFFTPQYIVDYIIATVAPQPHERAIDPSCGSGAFLLGLIRYFVNTYHKSVIDVVRENVYGVDILAYNIRRCKLLICLFALLSNEIIEEDDIHVITADSLKHAWGRTFDVVVGNPPYVKFQDMEDEMRTFLSGHYVTTHHGTYNLYFAFFELGLNLLGKGGRLGYITPNNYFTSLSGEPLRLFFQMTKAVYQIVDFDCTKVFDVQTYTALTFLNKVENESIKYDRIGSEDSPAEFLSHVTLTDNYYTDLASKKWRLLCDNERTNIHSIESSGETLGNLLNICVGIATLKDEVFFIDPYEEDDSYFYVEKKGKGYQIEKTITKPLVKISDMKSANDIQQNRRRIIFPYTKSKGKATPIEENVLRTQYPRCYEYLLSVKKTLEARGKGKHRYTPFYMYGRSQGLNRSGVRIYTPTFSMRPRFLLDTDESGFFTNGYGLYFNEENNTLWGNPIGKKENVDVLLKILNSSIMDYYVKKTSVSIEGGYPCYQKNFIERFTIPDLTENQIRAIRDLSDSGQIDEMLCDLYHINLRSPKRSL